MLIQRSIAVFFLVVAFTDLCCLLECSGDLADYSVPNVAGIRFATGDFSDTVTGNDLAPLTDTDSGCDECFCCAQVAPTFHRLDAPMPELLTSESRKPFLPTPTPRSLFHPPRVG